MIIKTILLLAFSLGLFIFLPKETILSTTDIILIMGFSVMIYKDNEGIRK